MKKPFIFHACLQSAKTPLLIDRDSLWGMAKLLWLTMKSLRAQVDSLPNLFF